MISAADINNVISVKRGQISVQQNF